jgi:hypothetical protein
MITYSNPKRKKSNFLRYIKGGGVLPLPFLKFNLMEIGLHRKYFKDNYTIGRLFVDSQYFCDTLEDKTRDLKDLNHDGDFNDKGEGKIYGQTAIPCGRYKVQLHYWQKHHKEVPILMNVPGFTGILIHTGVTQKDTEGCILVGQNKQSGRLTNGPYYLVTLTEKIREALNDKEEVYITIKE